MTRTANGEYVAFYPNTSVPFPCCDMERSVATNASMTEWRHTGKAFLRPTDLSMHQGFRDPHRPFEMFGRWWMGVGTGSGADDTQPLAGRIRLFRADDTSECINS